MRCFIEGSGRSHEGKERQKGGAEEGFREKVRTVHGKDTGRLSTHMRLRSAGNERQTFVKKASDERGGNNSACLDRTST
jgi:hypothetical protein